MHRLKQAQGPALTRALPALRILAALVLAACAAWFTPELFPAMPSLTLTNSVLSILLLILYGILFHKTLRRENTRAWKTAYPLGLLFSAFLTVGAQVSATGNFNFQNGALYGAVLSFSLVFCALLTLLWNLLDRLNARGARRAKLCGGFCFEKLRHKRLVAWLLLIACWLPVWLAVFPGLFCYDAHMQWQQVVNEAISAHHPPLHTLLLGGIIELVHRLTGSYNAGIAVFIFLQMLVVTGCFAFTLSRMARWGVSRGLLLFAAAYFALFPVIPMFGLCSSKDTLFTAFTLLFLVLLIDLLRRPKAFFSSPGKIARLIAAAFLMNAFRNNAVYALLPFLLLCLILLKRYRVKLSLVLAAAVVLTAAYTGPFFDLLQIGSGNVREMLCVPMQQLARVYRDNPDSLNEPEKQTLLRYLPEQAMTLYQPQWADPVKNHFNGDAFSKNKGEFIRLWVQVGLKNPGIYINSFLENTLYAWYPDSIIDGYNKNASADNVLYPPGKTSYMEYRVEAPGTLDSKFPSLYRFYEGIAKDTAIYQIPVVSMLFSVGFHFWILLTCIFYAIHRNRKAALLPALFMLLLCLTVLLGPMILTRYFLILFFALPLNLAFLLRADAFKTWAPPAALDGQ